MFKWIKQLFKTDNNYYAGLPFARWQSESLPCASMQSEIIANELVGEKLCFSEPVNLIVESLKEEGRWTWEIVLKNGQHNKHYILTDSKTNLELKVFPSYASLATCSWASYRENNHMGSEMLKMIATKTRQQEVKEKEEQREKITSLYKKASNAE